MNVRAAALQQNWLQKAETFLSRSTAKKYCPASWSPWMTRCHEILVAWWVINEPLQNWLRELRRKACILTKILRTTTRPALVLVWSVKTPDVDREKVSPSLDRTSTASFYQVSKREGVFTFRCWFSDSSSRPSSANLQTCRIFLQDETVWCTNSQLASSQCSSLPNVSPNHRVT